MDALAALQTERTVETAWRAYWSANRDRTEEERRTAFQAAIASILLWDDLSLYADAHLCLLRIQRAYAGVERAQDLALDGLERAAKAEGAEGSPAYTAQDVLSVRTVAVTKAGEGCSRIAAQELRARDEIARRREALVLRAEGLHRLPPTIRDAEIARRLYAVGDLEAARRIALVLERRIAVPTRAALDGGDELARLRAREAHLLAVAETAETVTEAIAADRALADLRAERDGDEEEGGTDTIERARAHLDDLATRGRLPE